ncbi:MAG TPA: membrane protein insertase YidC [Bacteroidales bacterium]|nr:membrane protein insertase YidC [Bacteroidales bacterium]
MDRNTITGLVLIFAIFVGYIYFTKPSEEELLQRQHVADSISMVRAGQARFDSLLRERQLQQPEQQAIQPDVAAALDSIQQAAVVNRLGYFAGAATGDDDGFILENEKIKLFLSSKGGKIVNVELKNYQTYDSLPLFLYNNDDTRFGYTFFSANRSINTNDLYFTPHYTDSRFDGQDSLFVAGDDSLTFAMRLHPDGASGSYIEYVYTLYGDKYMMDYKLNIVGMNQVIDAETAYFDLNWKADLRRQEASLDNERNESTIYYKYIQDDVDYLSERKNVEEKLSSQIKWISFKSRFFLSTIIADQAFPNAQINTFTDLEQTDKHYLRTMQALIAIPYNNTPTQSFGAQFYFGPNKYSTLKKFHMQLERQVPLGWGFFLLAWINQYAVIPVFDWLGGYGWSYGIVILILTVLLKLVLFPIAYKTYKSSARMRVLKPEVEEINKKYPKTEDAMKKQQETMALYKKVGVNPMAGCLPMLLQFPILIAMFRFFPSSIELRQESFLWAHDLSSYDSILDLPFSIPFYGDHVSLFTLLMTISTIIYTKVNNEMMGSANAQMPGMKIMMYIMPVMFLGIFNNYASGLSYYYLLANLITFAQIFLIRRTIDEDKIRAQILANKKKPLKKSKFQHRLEEIAKQRGVDPKTGKRK